MKYYFFKLRDNFYYNSVMERGVEWFEVIVSLGRLVFGFVIGDFLIL